MHHCTINSNANSTVTRSIETHHIISYHAVTCCVLTLIIARKPRPGSQDRTGLDRKVWWKRYAIHTSHRSLLLLRV